MLVSFFIKLNVWVDLEERHHPRGSSRHEAPVLRLVIIRRLVEPRDVLLDRLEVSVLDGAGAALDVLRAPGDHGADLDLRRNIFKVSQKSKFML